MSSSASAGKKRQRSGDAPGSAKSSSTPRASGRLRALAAPFRRLDDASRKQAASARLDALEADAVEADGGGDDEAFYVDDETTEMKSRGGGSGGGGGGGKAGRAAAAAAAAASDARRGVRPLAETVAAELGLLDATLDLASGRIDSAALRAAARSAAAGAAPAPWRGGAGGASAPPPPALAYVLSAAAPSRYPGRPHCSVCGFRGGQSCVRCGSRVCSAACSSQHRETRCLVG